MGRVTERRRVVRIRQDGISERADTLVAEDPLEIRVNGRRLAVTMRTPGDDFALAAGFLVSEGVLAAAPEAARIAYCAGAAPGPAGTGSARESGTGESGTGKDRAGEDGNTYNVVDVRLADGVPAPDASLERSVYTTSSCGLCGKTALEAVRTTARWPLPLTGGPRLEPEVLSALPERLRQAQRVFDRTGGLHAAALFSGDGRLLDVREDVGRHNAVDKVVGRALLRDALPLRETVLLVSGRASFELVQKAVMAGIPALAAVSAPSSAAAGLAEETGLTLVGFLRGTSMNVYTGAGRLGLPSPAGP